MKTIYWVMSVGQTIKTYLIGLTCLALVSGGTSCGRDNEPKLQAVQLVNMQLERFALSVEGDASLSSIRFSIDNTAPEGLVENVLPLPYGVRLDKVRLGIVPTASAAKVEVAVGEDGAFDLWSAEREYQLGSDINLLRLRLSLSTEQGAHYEYKYRVQLRRYRFDPETIDWSGVQATGLPQGVSGAYLYAQPRSEDVLILRSSAAGNEYYSQRGEQFAPVPLTGLGAAERIEQVVSYGDIPYIYTSAGRVCRLEGTAWQPIAIGESVRALLGVLAPRQAGGEPRLALIIERGGQEVFASYADGRISTRSLAVPPSFPRRGVYSFTESKTYVGGSLTLVGERAEGGVPVQSTWYTTGLAEDWIQLAAVERPDRQGARPSTVLLLDDTLYRLETAGGLSLYTSADLGRTWKKNGEKSLPDGSDSFAGVDILGYPAKDHTIYLLRNVSVSAGGAMSLLSGRPKKHDW